MLRALTIKFYFTDYFMQGGWIKNSDSPAKWLCAHADSAIACNGCLAFQRQHQRPILRMRKDDPIKRGDAELKVFMGPEIQSHYLWPDDPANRLRGYSYGLRVAAEGAGAIRHPDVSVAILGEARHAEEIALVDEGDGHATRELHHDPGEVVEQVDHIVSDGCGDVLKLGGQGADDVLDAALTVDQLQVIQHQVRKLDQFLINFLFGENSGITAPVTVMSEDTKVIRVGAHD